MLTAEENDLLTHVGAGTPMGEMIRRFWLPVCLAEEIPDSDCDPIRVRLVGEDLVAFRDSKGNVGVMDEHCPHRGASLFFGRNEEGGLRCLYHGWKFAVDGTILETPCEPAESHIRHHLKHAAYPALEAGEVVWAYLGPKDKQPPFPDFWWTKIPAEHRAPGKIDYACNFVQAIEGAIDSSHADFLHSGYEVVGFSKERIRQIDPNRSTVRETHWEADDTDYGFRYAAIRDDPEDPEHAKKVRVTVFAVPFHCLLEGVPHMFVPSDDNNTWFFDIRTATKPIDRERSAAQRGVRVGVDVNKDRRKVRTLANNFLQDRQAMRERKERWAFSGMPVGKPHEDMMVIESMGPIYDRTKEHLGVQDIGVVSMRYRMLKAVRYFMATGEVAELDPAIPYDQLRGESRSIPQEERWQVVSDFPKRETALV